MTSFIIKLIAIVSMTLDHVGNLILRRFTFLNILGRIAFPLFAFQTCLGYENTKNLKKYIIRLLIFGLISEIPYYLMINSFSNQAIAINVLFTMLAGIIAMYIWDMKLDKKKEKYDKLFILAKLITIIGILLIVELLHFDYGAGGVLLILLTHILYNKGKYKHLFYIISFILFAIIKHTQYIGLLETKIIISLILFTVISLLIILLYNKKSGPNKFKYLFYAYYPLHITILLIMSRFMFL